MLLDTSSNTSAPEIFNTDQGSQFTSQAFTDVLKAHSVRISMDGKGRWMDRRTPVAQPELLGMATPNEVFYQHEQLDEAA
jgi:transposase InsO family protein